MPQHFSSSVHSLNGPMLPLTLVSAVLLLVAPKLAFSAHSKDSNASSSEAGKPAPVLLDDMRSLFVWGDSYSSNTYMDRVRRTSNYTWDHYESHTSSGGDVWPRFLVDSANTGRPSSDNISLYDFAISGSSIEPILLDGPKPNPSLVNETDSFMRWFVNEEEGRALWTPETSLFGEREKSPPRRSDSVGADIRILLAQSSHPASTTWQTMSCMTETSPLRSSVS